MLLAICGSEPLGLTLVFMLVAMAVVALPAAVIAGFLASLVKLARELMGVVGSKR